MEFWDIINKLLDTLNNIIVVTIACLKLYDFISKKNTIKQFKNL